MRLFWSLIGILLISVCLLFLGLIYDAQETDNAAIFFLSSISVFGAVNLAGVLMKEISSRFLILCDVSVLLLWSAGVLLGEPSPLTLYLAKFILLTSPTITLLYLRKRMSNFGWFYYAGLFVGAMLLPRDTVGHTVAWYLSIFSPVIALSWGIEFNKKKTK